MRREPGNTCVLSQRRRSGSMRYRCTIAARQEFAGYWEYMLEDAIFTAPAHPSWGGAGLIGGTGSCMGIGSLVMQQQDGKGRRVDLNMVVPASLLAPVLDDLLIYGRPNRPARPWLGLYAAEDEDGVVVSSMARNGPAQKAGLQEGDRLVSVGGTRISDLSGFWRAVWACGHGGDQGAGELLARGQPARPDPDLDRPPILPQGAKAALTDATRSVLALRRHARRLLAPWDGAGGPGRHARPGAGWRAGAA